MRLRCASTLCFQQMASALDGICVRQRALQKPSNFLGFLNAPPWGPPGGAPRMVRACSKTLKNLWKINKILLPANHVPAQRPKATSRDRLRNPWNPLKNVAKLIGSGGIRPVPGVRPGAARGGDPGMVRACSKTFKNLWKINKILLPANGIAV